MIQAIRHAIDRSLSEMRARGNVGFSIGGEARRYQDRDLLSLKYLQRPWRLITGYARLRDTPFNRRARFSLAFAYLSNFLPAFSKSNVARWRSSISADVEEIDVI